MSAIRWTRGQLLAALLFVSLAWIWGGSFVAIEMGLGSVPPLWFAGLRYLLAGAVISAFAAATGRFRPQDRAEWLAVGVVGGLVVADNAVEGPHEFGTLRRLIAGDGGGDEDGDGPDDPTDAARGIAAYLEHVRSAEGFETTLLPVGEGLAVTRRTE
jgi:hypothetical protein